MRNGAMNSEAITSTKDAKSTYPIELPGSPSPRSSSVMRRIEKRNVPSDQSDANIQNRGLVLPACVTSPTVSAALGDVYGFGWELLMASVCQRKVLRLRLERSGRILNYERLYQGQPTSPNRKGCLLYTSPSPRDRTRSRMPSSA